MNTNHKSAAELAAALAGNPKVEQDVRDEIIRNSMVSHLLGMRVARGLTQEQIAQKMGCDPSKISRMESGNDLQLKWADVINYTSALNAQMCVLFEDPSMPAAERIKQCVFTIHEQLDKLTALAAQIGGNDEIAKKIHQFSGEVLFNFMMRYADHSAKLRSVVRIAPQKLPRLVVASSEVGQLEDSEPTGEPAEV